MTGLQYGNGEILAAHAANEAGIPFTLSAMSICSIEQVAEATGKPFWFQLYMMRDRGFIAELIARAKAVNCSALGLTVDLQVLGQRHCDLRNGLAVPLELKLGNILNMASKPAWVLSVMKSKSRTFGNLRTRQGNGRRQITGGMDGQAVRPGAELGRYRMGQD